ncbi:MAG: hypothetical protein ACYTBJ_22630 [Planctomycetota bacterium]|jgi:hypothetical protein
MTFSDAIEKVMLANGYFASLQHIYRELRNYREPTGKTPYKTIQERVQRDKRFTRIGVGVYGLTDFLDRIEKPQIPKTKKERVQFEHAAIQGMLLEIGELHQYGTYTPDKGKSFDGKRLGLIASLRQCPPFTFPRIIQETARFIDVIWFNRRLFPYRAFEVESSTDFRGSLTKFCELQDFATDLFIIAPEGRKEKYQREIKRAAFGEIAERCKFRSFESVQKYYEGLLKYRTIRNLL